MYETGIFSRWENIAAVTNVQSQMMIANCFDHADVRFRITSKADKLLRHRAFDISTVHYSYYHIMKRDRKSAYEALAAMTDKQKEWIVARDPELASLFSPPQKKTKNNKKKKE